MSRPPEDRPGAGSPFGGEDPFVAPRSERRLDRRLRGRLVCPVSLWTAESGGERAGLTVSSLVVSEGDPAQLFGVIDPLSELHELARAAGRFLVHLLEEDDEAIGSFFAGLYPVDPFAELDFEQDPYGPRLVGDRSLVRCRFVSSEPAGYQNLVRGEIDELELTGSPRPLAWYRGSYRHLI